MFSMKVLYLSNIGGLTFAMQVFQSRLNFFNASPNQVHVNHSIEPVFPIYIYIHKLQVNKSINALGESSNVIKIKKEQFDILINSVSTLIKFF